MIVLLILVIASVSCPISEAWTTSTTTTTISGTTETTPIETSTTETTIIETTATTMMSRITTSRMTDPDQCASAPCQNGAGCVDKTRDFICVCPEGFSGKTCDRKVSKVTISPEVEVSPDRGPQAGGTNLRISVISGIKRIEAVFLSLPGTLYVECKIIDRSDNRVTAQTPTYNKSVTTNVVLSINVGNMNTTWRTGYTFKYKPNPSITNIQPNTTLIGGGTKLTVSGQSIDAVAQPRITFGVMHCFIINEQGEFIEGSHMDRGVTVGDYTVFIGKGICETAPGSLTTSTLLCNPPKPIPQKSADFDSKYHRIQVRIGNYVYDYGSMWYPWWINMKIVIPAAVALGVLLLIVTIPSVIAKTCRRQQTSDREANRHESTIILPPVMTEDMKEATEHGKIFLPPVHLVKKPGSPYKTMAPDPSNFEERWEPGNIQADFKSWQGEDDEQNMIRHIYLHNSSTESRNLAFDHRAITTETNNLYENMIGMDERPNQLRTKTATIAHRNMRQNGKETGPTSLHQHDLSNDGHLLNKRDSLQLPRNMLSNVRRSKRFIPEYRSREFGYKHF